MRAVTSAEKRGIASGGRAPDKPMRKKALASVIFAFFALANIYDMNGTLGLKYISYALLVLLVPYARHPLRLRVHEEIGIALLFFVWPLCCLLMGVSNGADLAGAHGAIPQSTPFLG